MFIDRDIASVLKKASSELPVISLTGPRQSGKSTLLKELFADYTYVSLEDPEMRSFALNDPRGFLALYPCKVILDEVQRVPELFSYLQGVVDASNEPGMFVVSGSQNFLLMRSISQSLAGRARILHLLPLSAHELTNASLMPKDVDNWILKGGYPRLFNAPIKPSTYFQSYVQTYIDRDIRVESGVSRILEFNAFVSLCAVRAAQLLNMQNLATDCGITTKTARNWISVLEQSFIMYQLHPYYKNLGKRLVKTPKVYFYDTGLLCSLLGFVEPDDLVLSEARGALFENAVISELQKLFINAGDQAQLSFWRDSNGVEVDVVIERGARVEYLVEIKSSSTFDLKYFKNLTSVGELLGVPPQKRVVVYGGASSFDTSFGKALSYQDIFHFFGENKG